MALPRLFRPAFAGLCLAFVALARPAAAQTTIVNVASIAQLRAQSAVANVRVVLAPGTYWLTGPTSRPSPAADYPIFLDLSGAGSTYVFTGATLKVDTRELRGYGRVYGHADTVRVLQVSGTNTTVDGLALSAENVAYNGTDAYGAVREYTADWSTNFVEIIGSGVTVKNCVFTTRGSYPYGYGDAFGKGSRPADADGVTNAAWIDHRKHCGLRIGKGAANVTLDSVTLNMRSYGHGIFMQEGAHDILLRNCSVLGDTLASSNAVIAHPVYKQWGAATYGVAMPPDIRLSRHEDGIRVYTNPDSATNGWPASISNLTVENCRVERMRDALATGDMEGYLRVSDTQAYGCEQAFTPAALATENTFLRCKGDAVNGPLVFFRRSAANVTMEVELAGTSAPVGAWPVALISGPGHTLTLTRSAPAGLYPQTAYINCSQAWREWRHRPATDLDALVSGNVSAATTGSTIVNRTGLPLVFGRNATGNTGESDGGVLNKGANNTYVGTTLVPGPLSVTDTWGTYAVFSGTQSAGDLAALGGFQADAGTRVEAGGTLVVAGGLQFQGEPLTLAGTLASPGAVANSTRFNSTATAPITLDGDAVVAVTGAASQFLIGPVGGAGSLTKTGPGNLVMESNANTFSGGLVISAGQVTARANKAVHALSVAAGTFFRGQASLSLNQAATDPTVLDGTLVVNNRNDASAHTVSLGRLTGAGLVTTTGTGLGTVIVAGESRFDGVIEGRLGLVKTGADATLVLTGAHTYTGPTLVQAGVLAVSGRLPDASALTLAAGATLARTGPPGELRTGPQTWSGSATLRVQVAAPGSADSFTLAGPLTLDASVTAAAPARIVLVGGALPGFDRRRAYAWPLLAATALSGTTQNLACDATALNAANPAGGGAFRLTATSSTLALVFTPAPYAAWQLAHDLPADQSPTLDSDGDGRADLLEYALASDPRDPAAAPAAVLSLSAAPAPTLRLTFTRHRADVRYEVEASSDLITWEIIATDPGQVGETVTVVDSGPVAPGRFLRLRTSLPAP